jgi:type IV secretion system protein VirB8
MCTDGIATSGEAMKLPDHTLKNDPLVRAVLADGLRKFKQDRNRAYLLVIILLLCVMLLVAAILVLANVHTVIPVVSVIDANGHVIKQEVVNKESITSQESFVQHQVHQFIVYCNTFDPLWRQHYSDLCRLHATEPIAKQYSEEIAPDNPENPYYKLPKGGHRYPKITSIAQRDAHSYQVAFQLVTEAAGKEIQVVYYNALVRYRFTAKPIALGDRWENPLGFAAVAYRKDEELRR